MFARTLHSPVLLGSGNGFDWFVFLSAGSFLIFL